MTYEDDPIEISEDHALSTGRELKQSTYIQAPLMTCFSSFVLRPAKVPIAKKRRKRKQRAFGDESTLFVRPLMPWPPPTEKPARI